MIDFATIEPALEAWWTGFGMQTDFRDRSREQTRPPVRVKDPTKVYGARAFLKVTNVEEIGIDAVRHTVNATDNTRGDPEVVGHRVLTVQCMVDSYHDKADSHAVYLCERARTRLSRPAVEAAFQAAGIGILKAGPTVDLPFKADGRLYSRAAFDLRLNAAASDKSTDVASSSYTIAIVYLSSNVKGPDGVLLPAGYQLDNEVIDSTV